MTTAVEPAFIGRRTELDRLRLRLSGVHGGEARTVLVSGEAGVGKSRLLREFTAMARRAGAHVLHGSCDEYLGDAMPYLPLTEALDGFEREHGPAAAALGGPSYQLLAGLFDGTGQPPADALGTQHQVFLAVRRMLDHIGADAPVVLVVEDLHWADVSTLGLVGVLARARPEGRRVMLVCSHRPSDSDGVRDTPLWQMLSNADFLRRVEHFPLPPFTELELRQFLAGIATGDGVTPTAFDRCLEWSAGNAFRAEQLLRAGVLDRPEKGLPPLLTDVMMAPLAGASNAARRILRVAAVAGRRMSHGLLRTVSGLEGDALVDTLQECFDRRMLTNDQADGAYQFRHALLREAMYRAIPGGIKRDLHVTMAAAIADDPRLSVSESTTADAEEAYHWYAAGRRPEALAAGVRAGRAAERTLAFPSAERQFGRVLELWDQVADAEARAGESRVQVLAAAADAARWSAHITQAIDWVRAALELFDPDDDPDLAGRLHERLAMYLWADGQRGKSAEAYERAAGLLAGRPASAVKARVLAALAVADLRAGRNREGERKAKESLAMAREVGVRAEEGRALNALGLALGMRDDPAAGEALLHESLEIAREVHHLEDLFRGYSNLGLVLEHAGRLTEAADTALAGLAEARQLDLQDTRQSKVLANNASTALVLLGRWDEAESILTEASLSQRVAESIYPRLTLAEVQVARGRFEQAQELLTSVSDVEIEVGTDLRFLGPLHAAQAELLLWQGRLDEAADSVRRGIDIVRTGENALELLRLCVIGLRCEADRAGTHPGQAQAVGDGLARLASTALKDKERTAETAQLVLMCGGERGRISGNDSAPIWNQVADGWAELDRRYPSAYARWRAAEAAFAHGDLPQATEAALAAHETARALRAVPLQARVEDLAARAGIELSPRHEPAAQTGGVLPGLTNAEFEILALLYSEGLDNHGIAKRRSVSVRTVETQLRRIYAKVGVHSRAEAIIAARAGGWFDS